MSHHRHSTASRGHNAFLLYDIDNELVGWEDDENYHSEEDDPGSACRLEILQSGQHDPEPPRISDVSMIEQTPDVHADTQGEEEVWDGDDDLFVSLMASRADDDDTKDLWSDQDAETLLPSLDWGELDEFDPEDDEELDDDLSHPTIDSAHERIALYDKSQRAAARIIKDANWEREVGLPVLTEILVHHRCHPKTIGALRELTIEHRVDPEMLMTLHEIRSAWRSHGYNRVYSAFGARDGWTNLPWGIALYITEALGVQSDNEVMEFCGICFNDWCEAGFIEFPVFAYYLNFVISTIDSPIADAIHVTPDIARAMLTDRGEQYDLPGNPVDKVLEYYGIT